MIECSVIGMACGAVLAFQPPRSHTCPGRVLVAYCRMRWRCNALPLRPRLLQRPPLQSRDLPRALELRRRQALPLNQALPQKQPPAPKQTLALCQAAGPDPEEPRQAPREGRGRALAMRQRETSRC